MPEKVMVSATFNNMKFSKEGAFVLYDWRISDEYYKTDKKVSIYFFVKDINPRKTLDKMFVNQIAQFKFNAGFEEQPVCEGNIPETVMKYCFTKYLVPRVPHFDWSNINIPILRNTKLSAFKNSEEALIYLSKYIDN